MDAILFPWHISFIHEVNSSQKCGFIAYFIKRMERRTMKSHTSYKRHTSFASTCFSTVLLWMDLCVLILFSLAHAFSPDPMIWRHGYSWVLTWLDCSRGRPIRDFCQDFSYWKWGHQTNSGGTMCHKFWCSWWPWEQAISRKNNATRRREQWKSNKDNPLGI